MEDPRPRFLIPKTVLLESGLLLAEPGREGLEAVVLWIGRRRGEREVEVMSVYMPRQYAFRSERGVAVTVDEDDLTELIAALPSGTFIPARLHSHPEEAFHSATDDDNMLISHVGAISIVVPYFASRPIQLGRCSVNELGPDFRWRELARRDVEARFAIDG